MTPLRNIRLRLGLSLASVATAVQTDIGNLSRIETSVQRPSLKLAEDLSKFFDGEITEMELLYPERFDVADSKDFDDVSKVGDPTP